jgi:hypothetical protein
MEGSVGRWADRRGAEEARNDQDRAWGAVMMKRCFRGVLLLAGIVLLSAALLPVTLLWRIPEQYEAAFMSSKLLMLPLGALLLAAAAGLSTKLGRGELRRR